LSKFDPFSPSDFLFCLGDDTTRNRGSPRIPHVSLGGIEHKSCADCARLKPLDQFSDDKSRIDGLRTYCKECDNRQKEKRKRTREQNKQEAKDEWDNRDK